MTNASNFLDQLVKNDTRTYDNVRTIAKGREHDYATGDLLDYPYFKENYKLIATYLSKQRALDADSKAIKLNLKEIQNLLRIQKCSPLLKKPKKVF